MTKVKICGLSEEQHATLAAAAGADFIGMIFAPGRRQVSIEKASQLVKAVKNVKSSLITVGVFVNSSFDEINRIADRCRLDWVQLSGDESWEFCQKIERPLVKAIHVIATSNTEDIVHELKKGHDLFYDKEIVCLLDSKIDNYYGGTGQTFDWQIAKTAAERFPVLVAGGLTPDNVRLVIDEVNPWGVDVSSGIESNGQKDVDKITAFIEEVKKET
jgi:phosphoribosylanthranilate isomerase